MNEYQKKAIELENNCAKMLTNMGWTVRRNSEPILLDNGFIYPDLTIKTPSGLEGAVEVKSLEEFLLENYQTKNNLLIYLSCKTIPFMIFTNNSIFDIYIYGDFRRRLTTCPEPEDIEILLEKHE